MLPDDLKANATTNGQCDAAIDAAVGLSEEEAQSCYARTLVQLRRIDPAAVAQEKRRVIARERVLEWYDPIPGGLDAVGGLDDLKTWLQSRRTTIARRRARMDYPPRRARSCWRARLRQKPDRKTNRRRLGVPLLRVDLGALKSKFVGKSAGQSSQGLQSHRSHWPALFAVLPKLDGIPGSRSGGRGRCTRTRGAGARSRTDTGNQVGTSDAKSLLNWNSHHAL